MTGYEHLAVAGEETGATTDDNHLLDPGRLKPREDLKPEGHQDPPARPDAVETLLRQFRPAIVRYCRARLARNRTRTGSLDEDDVAQEVCLALLSALPSYRDMGRPFGAFVLRHRRAQGGGRRARRRPRATARSGPARPARPVPGPGGDRARKR